jgi:hypothetical protein
MFEPRHQGHYLTGQAAVRLDGMLEQVIAPFAPPAPERAPLATRLRVTLALALACWAVVALGIASIA